MNYVNIKLLEQMAKNNMRSIKELHEKSGVSRTTISALLNGKKKAIHFDIIVRLCKTLNCDIGDLIKLTDNDKGAAS